MLSVAFDTLRSPARASIVGDRFEGGGTYVRGWEGGLADCGALDTNITRGAHLIDRPEPRPEDGEDTNFCAEDDGIEDEGSHEGVGAGGLGVGDVRGVG